MDDDQEFVRDLLKFIEDHDAVDYRTVEVETRDDGRDAAVTLELYTGDRYVITITEQH